MTDRLMYNSFRCHTPWLSTEQRNKVLPKYILYVERRWLTLGENALLHEPRILTDKEYLEMKRQLFPNRITGCPILTDYLSSGVLNEIMKDETNAYLRTLREERKSPSKGFPVGAYVTQIKDGEGGVYRITEPLDEDDCQMAERIVPRRYKNGKRGINEAISMACLSPEIFRIISPEEMNEKLIEFIRFIKCAKDE